VGESWVIKISIGIR